MQQHSYVDPVTAASASTMTTASSSATARPNRFFILFSSCFSDFVKENVYTFSISETADIIAKHRRLIKYCLCISAYYANYQALFWQICNVQNLEIVYYNYLFSYFSALRQPISVIYIRVDKGLSSHTNSVLPTCGVRFSPSQGVNKSRDQSPGICFLRSDYASANLMSIAAACARVIRPSAFLPSLMPEKTAQF